MDINTLHKLATKFEKQAQAVMSAQSGGDSDCFRKCKIMAIVY